MELYELVNLDECPNCGGTGYLEEEGDCGVYIVCSECGAQTVVMSGRTPEEKEAAAKKVEHLWNSGKAISSERGE